MYKLYSILLLSGVSLFSNAEVCETVIDPITGEDVCPYYYSETANQCTQYFDKIISQAEYIDMMNSEIVKKIPTLRKYPPKIAMVMTMKVEGLLQSRAFYNSHCGKLPPETVTYTEKVEQDYFMTNECVIIMGKLFERHDELTQFDQSLLSPYKVEMEEKIQQYLMDFDGEVCLNDINRLHLQTMFNFWTNI